MMLYYDDVFPTAEHKQEYNIAEAHGKTVGYPPSPSPSFRPFAFLSALKGGSIPVQCFPSTRSASDNRRPTDGTGGNREFDKTQALADLWTHTYAFRRSSIGRHGRLLKLATGCIVPVDMETEVEQCCSAGW